MTGFALRIDSWGDVPRAISQLRLAGQHHRVVLLSALYRGEIAHVEIQRETPACRVKQFCAAVRRPALVLIGDDDDAPTGPAGWRQTTRLLKWASYVIIHAAAGRPAEYEDAVAAALAFQRVLLVETDMAHLPDWAEAAHKAPGRPSLRVIVPVAGVHPVPVAREKMQ